MRISRDEPFTSSSVAFSLISPGVKTSFLGVILSPLVYILVFCAAFVGSGLKAVGGFGFATLTTPTVAIFWDVPTHRLISVPPSELITLGYARGRHEACCFVLLFDDLWACRRQISEPIG